MYYSSSSSSSLALTNCILWGNSPAAQICDSSSTPTIDHCVVQNGHAVLRAGSQSPGAKLQIRLRGVRNRVVERRSRRERVVGRDSPSTPP